MGGTASIRIVPIHSKTTIQRTELHNERKEGDLTGKHIDKNKIIHNKDNDGIDDRITGFRDEDHDGIDDRYEDLWE